VADVTAENHRSAPGRVPVMRPVRPEPSWGRVLLTTVELWASRRLRQRLGVKKLVLAVAAAAAIVLAALQFAGAFATTASQPVRLPEHDAAAHGVSAQPAAKAQFEAVSWITGQVSDAAIIGCYPAMCAALHAQGVSASRLVLLGPKLTGVFRTDVIATLPTADQSLVNQCAPALIASFGSGGFRVEIRAVVPGGTAAYQSALRADLSARESAGVQLLRNPRIRFSALDASQLREGEVDPRLLATLAALSTQFALRVTAFSDSSPGAPLLYREVTVASGGDGNGAARLAAALAMVNAQESPYLPAHSAIVRPGAGQAALLIEFAAPSPIGLLTTVLTADVR
jgi:hypothetical protein